MTTGIFYHPSFSRRSYLTVGNRLKDFPGILEDVERSPLVKMYTSPRISRDLLLKIHDSRMVEEVDRDPLCSTAWESAGGVVAAAEEIQGGNVGNAFVFIGAGGHHAGRDYFGGACCFNDVAAAIERLRQAEGEIRVAILDTDAHHGDGTRELLLEDDKVLHCCVCSMDYLSPDGLKMDISFRRQAGETPGESYLSRIREVFLPALDDFRADFLIWYFGYDTHSGDYGSIGLTDECYMDLARMMVHAADEHCGGKLEVVLAGGSRPDIASAIIPGIILILAGEKEDMVAFSELNVQKSRRGLGIAGKFKDASLSAPAKFNISVMKSWLVAETTGSIEGERFIERIKGVLGEPSRQPSLVKGDSCNEADDETATGSTLSVVWDFNEQKRDEVVNLLSDFFGMLMPGD